MGCFKTTVTCTNTVNNNRQTDRHPFNGHFLQDNLGKLAPERLNYYLDFNEASEDGMAVASAGPCANHLHLASVR